MENMRGSGVSPCLVDYYFFEKMIVFIRMVPCWFWCWV